MDLKIFRDINWSMAHIFVTVHFLGNAYLLVQLSIFEDKVCPGHQDDGQQEDAGQPFTLVLLDVERDYVELITS